MNARLNDAAIAMAEKHARLVAALDSETKHKFELYVKGFLGGINSELLGKLCAADPPTVAHVHELITAQFGESVALMLGPIIFERARERVDQERLALADRIADIVQGR